MTRCTHCHGTGQEFAPQSLAYSTRRTPRPMIPFGNETAVALRAGTLKASPYLFAGDCPHIGKDRWMLAREHIFRAGKGAALVLPAGACASDYRFPALPLFEPFGLALVAWAYGADSDAQHALGRALIENGLACVQVLGGNDGPLEFRAA